MLFPISVVSTPTQRYNLLALKRRLSDSAVGPVTTREYVRIPTHAPVSMYAYAATSSYPGVGGELVASRLIGPSSPPDNGEFVDEYAEGEHMTGADFYKCMLGPDPERPTGYGIMFKTLIRDG